MRYWKLVLPSLLVAIMVFGLTVPTQGQYTSSVELKGLQVVRVCSNFRVDLWVNHPDYDLGSHIIQILFDPTQMEYIGKTNVPNGWEIKEATIVGGVQVTGTAMDDPNGYIFAPGSDKMVTLIFHCLDEGTSTIYFDDADLYTEPEGEGTEYGATFIDIEVTQRKSVSVGGLLTSTNKLTILAPYLGLVGLVAAIAYAAIIIKRRKN